MSRVSPDGASLTVPITSVGGVTEAGRAWLSVQTYRHPCRHSARADQPYWTGRRDLSQSLCSSHLLEGLGGSEPFQTYYDQALGSPE